MNAWTIAQFAVFVSGLLLAFAGDKLSIPFVFYGGFSLFGIAAFLIGAEAIVTKRIVLGPRRYSETYLGLPAVAQGVQFLFLGLFFIGVSFLAYFNTGRDVFLQLVRRPWPILFAFGMYCLMQAVIAISGYQEEKQGTRWVVILNLLTSRWLPGAILIMIGLGGLALAFLDLTAPALFDKLGGGFLEMVYGLG